MKEDVMAAVATMIGTKISEAVPTMINEAFRLDQKPIIDQCKASIDQKYLAAGISSWRDAAGKYLTDMFSQETLANSGPTEEGAKQSLEKKSNKKPPLDPVRIKILRDFVNYFDSKFTTKKEEILGKGRVTSRIHCATKQAREKLELLESQQ
ncbi:hypothetical protein BV898_19073 [Hypsibius exemplaris]|uniref:BEN domain-containing protein n=1 Tax=Hypsibius exemplaris TaxID=2072580 RepID=A0A9X6NK47_HYPEX|nr:hypothetical protein BV898_19073 [Hypsibius exemplaris]